MTTQTQPHIDAISALLPGQTLTFDEVSWDEYDQLLLGLGHRRRVRLAYNRGRLEIISPSSKHERYKEFLSHLARVLAIELGCELESLGSTTLRQQWQGRGVEPDVCFYVQNAPRIIGKNPIDLNVDPPPDVVVEIDLSHPSTIKQSIYHGMGVRELWNYDGQQATIYVLTEHGYTQAQNSMAFPVRTPNLLSEFLEKSETAGQSAALQEFSARLRGQR